jgi:hypothetical protein
MRPPLTISAAARLCRVDRRTLQRAIHAGRLRLDARHGLRHGDLVAAGYLVQETPQATPQHAPQDERLCALLLRLTEAIEGLRQTTDTAAVAATLADLQARLAQVEQDLGAVVQGVTPALAQVTAWWQDVQARLGRLEEGRSANDALRNTSPFSLLHAPLPPAFDPAKFRLGKLCDQGHAWVDTGQTLRRVPSGVCPQCDTAAQRTRRAARRNGARGPEGRGNGA